MLYYNLSDRNYGPISHVWHMINELKVLLTITERQELVLKWPNTVFAHALADAIQHAHKNCKTLNMPSFPQ